MESQDLNPELAGQAIMKEAVPIGAKPVNDVDTFAMIVDSWHAEKMEYGNRLLEIPVGTTVNLTDAENPGVEKVVEFTEENIEIFRIGVMSALHIFKDLPFGVTMEEAKDE